MLHFLVAVKMLLLLQMERSYYSSWFARENAFLGTSDGVTHPWKWPPFLGAGDAITIISMSPSPRNAFLGVDNDVTSS